MDNLLAEHLAEVASQNREMREALQGLLEMLANPREPDVLTKEAACFRLSIGATKLKGMIRAGEIGTCLIGKVEMIPMSEIKRLSTPARAATPRRSGGRKKRPVHSGKGEAQEARARLRSLPKRG